MTLLSSVTAATVTNDSVFFHISLRFLHEDILTTLPTRGQMVQQTGQQSQSGVGEWLAK